ncbi:MAG: hypothetical protein AAFQ82_27045, partial [Myxococcota bacterium]
QVLHPEKYIAGEAPIAIDEPTWNTSLRRLGSNVLGEVQIRYILNDENAAAGWGGDRYTLFDHNGNNVLVWMSTWDSPTDADEFSSAWRRYIGTRLQRNRNQDTPSLPQFVNDRFEYRRENTIFRIQRQGSHVLILEGPTESGIDQVGQNAWAALSR